MSALSFDFCWCSCGIPGSGDNGEPGEPKQVLPWAFGVYGLEFRVEWKGLSGSFRKLGVPYLGVLIIRILLFRVLY